MRQGNCQPTDASRRTTKLVAPPSTPPRSVAGAAGFRTAEREEARASSDVSPCSAHYAVVVCPSHDEPDSFNRLVAEIPEPMRRRGGERDRVAGFKFVALFPDRYSKAATDDIPIF